MAVANRPDMVEAMCEALVNGDAKRMSQLVEDSNFGEIGAAVSLALGGPPVGGIGSPTYIVLMQAHQELIEAMAEEFMAQNGSKR